MLSKLRFCLMWYLYLLKVLHRCIFNIVLFTKSCLRLYLVQLISTKFLMPTLVWQKIPSGLFKITKYIKYLYIYLQKQEVITTGYFSVSCNRMIIIEIDSKFPPHSTVFFLRNYAVVILAHFQMPVSIKPNCSNFLAKFCFDVCEPIETIRNCKELI